MIQLSLSSISKLIVIAITLVMFQSAHAACSSSRVKQMSKTGKASGASRLDKFLLSCRLWLRDSWQPSKFVSDNCSDDPGSSRSTVRISANEWT